MKNHNEKLPKSAPSKPKKKRSSSDGSGIIITKQAEVSEEAMLDEVAMVEALEGTKQAVWCNLRLLKSLQEIRKVERDSQVEAQTQKKAVGELMDRLLLSALEVGKLLGIGRSTFWRWHAEGRVPLPVHVCGVTRWKAAEIHEWVEAGCPPRERWEAIKKC